MNLREDWEFRGLIHQVTDATIFDRLAAGSVTAYIGFDPTASSLHLGSLFQICNLRRLQMSGNRPIVVAGGGTGMIGDPSFKDQERPLMTRENIDANVASIGAQLESFLDFSKSAAQSRAILVNNADWLTTVSLTDFLRDVGKHFTVNQLIAKDSVKSRLDRDDVGLSFTEFSYVLLQSYDFLRLHLDHNCELQMGGSDQWGNITAGCELVRRVTGDKVFGLTSPLLTRSDGRKYGKSEGGNDRVWLDATRTSPFTMYQFLLNTDDDVVTKMLRMYTFLEHDEIRELDETVHSAPQERRAQRALAMAVVTFIHGSRAAHDAERASGALFSEAIAELDEATFLDVTANAPTSKWSRSQVNEGVELAEALVRMGLAQSKAEARRFVEQGGVYLNNVRVGVDDTLSRGRLLHDRYVVVRRGRQQTHLVVVE